MKIQRKNRPESPVKRLFSFLMSARAWIFGLMLILCILLLRSLQDSAPSSPLLRIASPIIQHGALTCEDVQQKVSTGEWIDPNHGRVYARETITLPQFFISLHTEEYDPVRWKIMNEGKYYEDDVHKRFVTILENKTRSYVLDVGANIGYYTLLSAALGHDVISFEPNPANLLRLCNSLRLNNFQGVDLFQRAVSNEEGEMSLIVPRNPGQAFLKPLQDGGKIDEHQAKTKVITLDAFAEKQGWFDRKDFRIALLKVDVEGKEPLVFLGASRLLASGLVQNVLTEGRRFGRPNIIESFTVLFEAGYTLKEPVVELKGATPKDHAQSVVDYYMKTLGQNSQKTTDLWWVKA